MADRQRISALSAHPSPGGQDALATIQRYDDAGAAFREALSDDHYNDTQRRELRRALTTARNEVVFALAARQPVGEHGESDEFLAGVCVALQCVTAQDCGVLWAEIVRAVGVDDLLQYATFIEPAEWDLAGFSTYASPELNRRRPRSKAAKQAKRPTAQAVGEPTCSDCGTPLLFECTGCSRSNYPPCMQGPVGEIVYSGEGGLQIEFYDGKPLAPMKLYTAPPAPCAGEPVAWVNGRHLDECIAMPMIESNDDATVLNPRNIAASSRPDGYTDTPLYRHPAQAVDHQAALLAEERAHGETIDQRDRCEEVADELADHIARITGVDIGEHSSANCPWQNAIEAAEEYKPAQAVGLGAVREALRAAEGLATVCASVDGYSREEVAASGRAMRQQFADALAKVDSQAVGNG